MKTRILLSGLAALAVMAFGASSASATTVSPPGPFTPTSTSAPSAVNFRVGTVAFSCTSSKIPGVVSSTGTVVGLTPTFSGCTSGLGATTITAKEPIRYELAFNSTGLVTTLRNINLNFKTYGGTCNFNVAGYESTENRGLSPLTVSKLVFANASTPTTPATLRLVSGELGPCAEIFAGNPYVNFGETYTLSPSLVVSR